MITCRVALKNTFASRACVHGIRDIALIAMRAAVCDGVCFTCVVIRMKALIAYKGACLVFTAVICILDIASFSMRATIIVVVVFTYCIAKIMVISVITWEACKRAFLIFTCIICTVDITWFVMRAAIPDVVCFACIVIDVKTCSATAELTFAINAHSRSRIARKCIAILAGRSAVGIIIDAEILLVSSSRLLADIAVTFFFDTRADGADLLDGARLADIAICAASRAGLVFGAITSQRIQAITVLTVCGNAFSVLTCAVFPAILEGAILAR